MERLVELGKKGAEHGEGSPKEARLLLGGMIDDSLADVVSSLTDKLKYYRVLEAFVEEEGLIPQQDFALDKAHDVPPLMKWNSGFSPIDLVVGGLYQGILVIMGAPGVGKTSLMLTLQEEIVKRKAASSTWFFENEIPGPLLLSRMKQGPLIRTTYRGTDLLRTGPTGPTQILQRLEADPDPERVIFFDSPDVLAAGGGADDRRFQLESIYQGLVQVKQLCKLVVVSSQPRRVDASDPKLQSLAESWAKAWFSDVVLGIRRDPRGGGDQLKITGLKNRFGPPAQAASFEYNYLDLSWRLRGMENSNEDEW